HAVSPRGGRPLVAVDCGAHAPEALLGELFGDSNKRGQLSLADGGTLVVTELERLDPALRARVLSTLSEWRRQSAAGKALAEVRLIIDIESAAENEDEAQAVAAMVQGAL